MTLVQTPPSAPFRSALSPMTLLLTRQATGAPRSLK